MNLLYHSLKRLDLVSALGPWLFVFGWLSFSLPNNALADEAKTEELLTQASQAFRQGKKEEAVALASKAIEADTKSSKAVFLRGQIYEQLGRHEKAIADFDVAAKLEPRNAAIYQRRGTEHFKLGHFPESIADFDKYLEFTPDQAPHHWQRGISYYYAGRFAEGRKQFESHQTVNPNDVENAVWHYLCVARASGVEKARAALIPISGDGRVPMMQVHALFGGKMKPEEVLETAKAGNPSPARLNEQLFYAHLYLGLYYEASGDKAKTREHIFKAADEFKSDHYMGDVARVHAALLRKK